MVHARTEAQLVYLTLQADQGRIQLNEDLLFSSLGLQHQTDDPRLLIALGEMSASPRPLPVYRISRLEHLLLLWISPSEWIALPLPISMTTQDHQDPPPLHRQHNIEQAFENAFGGDVFLEPIPDGSYQAQFSPAGRRKALQAESEPLGTGHTHIIATDMPYSVCIRPWITLSRFDLLLTRKDHELLQRWLAIQH